MGKTLCAISYIKGDTYEHQAEKGEVLNALPEHPLSEKCWELCSGIEKAIDAQDVKRLAINTALLPPNAKELDMTVFSLTSVRPWLGT